MIYFSIIGFKDSEIDIKDPFNTCGATVNIFMDLKDDIDSVYLFLSKTGTDDDETLKDGCIKNEKIMKSHNKDIEFKTVELDFFNDPSDYALVYPEMKAKITEVMVTNDILDKEKIINISSGTPTMTTCWVFLQQSGAIPNARLFQGRPKKYARNFGKSHQEVEFETEWFPKVKAGDVEEKQLENSVKKVEKYKEQIANQDLHDQFPGLIGRSPLMTQLKQKILRYASSDDNILIIGESGTGKELVSKALHEKSDRKGKPFQFRNLAGEQSDDLINSLLFGIEKGTATNVEASKGYLRECEGGTLVMDEIGDLSYDVQTKLLRAIEYQEIEPVGASKAIKINVRILGATNKDIKDLNKKDKFRTDFLSRFNKLIEIPPLRDRGDDINELIQHFANDVIFTEKCLKSLRSDSYRHANVRELLHILDNAKEEYAYEKRPLERNDIPKTPVELLNKQKNFDLMPRLPFQNDMSMKTVLETIKFDYYDKALRRNDGVKERAAKELNMEPHTLRKHLREKDSK